jgi:hypothetical protein
VVIDEVSTDKDAVERQYRPIVDELNQDIKQEDEKWRVFGGGFFPAKQGFEIDDLFK